MTVTKVPPLNPVPPPQPPHAFFQMLDAVCHLNLRFAATTIQKK